MNIIEGAAYLSPFQNKVFIACEGWLLYRSDFGDESFLTDPEFFPADLVLLYVPGDKVFQMEDTWANLNLADFEAGNGGTKHGTVTKIYREH